MLAFRHAVIAIGLQLPCSIAIATAFDVQEVLGLSLCRRLRHQSILQVGHPDVHRHLPPDHCQSKPATVDVRTLR